MLQPVTLTPQQMIQLLEQGRRRHGGGHCNSRAILTYSGPAESIIAEFAERPSLGQQVEVAGQTIRHIRGPIGNRRHAINMHHWLSACMIDHTHVGITAFETINIYDYFKKTEKDKKKARIDADTVARDLSHKFIMRSHGRVYTSICGAGRDRVFVETELPAILRNRQITHINGVDAKHFRDRLRKRYGKNYLNKSVKVYQDEALRHLALSELKLLKAVAETLRPGKMKEQATLMYAQSRDLYRIDRRLTASAEVACRPVYQGKPKQLRTQRKADIRRMYHRGMKPRRLAMSAGLHL